MTNTIVAQTSLIPLWNVTVARGAEQAVDARDLHKALEVGKDFSTWVKYQIERGSFTEGEDFTSGHRRGGVFINDLAGLRPGLDYTIEYYLTLEMAKHVAMMSGVPKGKEVRNYFIACERAAKAAQKPMSPAEVLIHQGQLMLAIEQEQARQSAQLLAVQQQTEANTRQTEANTKQLQQIETATDHFTIMGWHRYAKQSGSLPLATAAKMGKEATHFCNVHDLAMGSVPDPRFGTVKTYPKWVLDELFTAIQ